MQGHGEGIEETICVLAAMADELKSHFKQQTYFKTLNVSREPLKRYIFTNEVQKKEKRGREFTGMKKNGKKSKKEKV